MAAYNDYAQLTKVDKSWSISLKKSIFETSRKLGSGVSSSVPYDTAWVARIPEINTFKPAFPESLQWLRDHQAKDGTWGVKYPDSIHSQILNTFSAILALSQWNYEDDKEIIEKGIKALEMIAKCLPQEETYNNSFEMITASFLDDARAFKLGLAVEHLEWCHKIGKQKLKSIKKDILSNKQNKYWSFLEAAGSLDLEIASYRNEVTRYGLIAAQPAPTAFLLRYARLRGKDFPESEWVLKNLCAQNQGGIPHLIPIDTFEIVNGLDFLFKANINPRINTKYGVTQKVIDKFKFSFDPDRGIGFSSNWSVSDSECTASALRVARQISGETDCFSDGLKTKIPRNSSLNLSKDYSSSLTSDSSEALNFLNKFSMQGVRNISSYYALLQHVFATPSDASETFTEVETFLGKNQNSDGGWGGRNSSSEEETAYACLIIFHLVQTKKGILDSIDFPKLVEFINTVDIRLCNESFWCYKVTFGSAVLTELVVTAARHGIFQIQRLCMFTDALNDSKIDMLHVDFRDEKDQLVHQGTFPLTRPEVRREEIEISQAELDDAYNSILQGDSKDPYVKNLFDVCLEFSYYQNDYKMLPFDRVTDSLAIVFLFFFTDFIDFHLEGNEYTTELDEAMKAACDILRGVYPNCDSLPDFNLPRLKVAWRWWFYLRNTIDKNNWSSKSFAKTFEDGIFKSYSTAYKLRCFRIELTSKRYLELAKTDVGLDELARYSALLQDSTVDLEDFQNDEIFQKYKDCAIKAGRICSDVPSVFRDLSLSHSDNYCVALMQEYRISVSEAMMKATKKIGKEIMKMYALKKIILAREDGNSKTIMILTLSIERFVNACLHWALNSSRYDVGQKSFVKRVNYERKDLVFTWDLCFE